MATETPWGDWQIETWFLMKGSEFFPDIYFFTLEHLKNGNMRGKAYAVERDRPRAKAKPKTKSFARRDGLVKISFDQIPFDRFAS